MIKIHNEGFKIIAIIIGILLIINIIVGSIMYLVTLITSIILIASILIIIFVLRFFRKPFRKFKHSSEKVYAPADGTIVAIEEINEPEYFMDKRLKVSIFMSVWNVHVNYYPVSGLVKYMKYHPGKYLLARHPKSSELNERTSLVIKNKTDHEILVRQIAGIVARRVVFYSKEGEKVKSGDEMGFIKFGSRVDIFLPLNSEVKVKIGEKVKACVSEIAILH